MSLKNPVMMSAGKRAFCDFMKPIVGQGQSNGLKSIFSKQMVQVLLSVQNKLKMK